MKLIDLEFKNFGPYGNLIQKIDLRNEDIENKLVNISAKNGSGKTTILNVIVFLLYGKVPGISKGFLVNRINRKDAWGVIRFFDSNNRLFKIERAIKPNKFNVWIDGKPYDAAKDVQMFLEEDIYKMNFNVFTNTISISVSDFKSLLVLTPDDKRKIIDRLFGYYVINDMLAVFKKRQSDINKSINTLNTKIEEKEESINDLNDSIQEVIDKKSTKDQKNIKKLTSKYKIEKTKYDQLLNKKNIFKEKYDKLISIISKLKNNKTLLSRKTTELNKKLELFDDDKCPTCQSDLTSDFHQEIKESLISDQENISRKYNKLAKKISELEEKKVKGDKILSQSKNKLQNIKENKNKLSIQIKLLKENTDADTSEFEKILLSYENDLDELQTELNKKNEDNQYYDIIIKNVLSETGIKQVLVQRIIQPLNELVSKYNKLLDFDKYLQFDEKFNVDVTHLGQSISPKTLSAGEKKKADLILLMSFLELIILQMPSLNTIFLDEALTSLDTENIELMLESLKLLSRKSDLSIYIVTHNDVEPQHFGKIIYVSKTDGFASISHEDVF